MVFARTAATAVLLGCAACTAGRPDVRSTRAAEPQSAAGAKSAVLEPAAPPERDFDTVLLVSVDGLRSDALIAVPGSLPGFDRLRAGAGTLNARTDPDRTVTLPNHTGMLTGRLVEGSDGHHWIRNDEVNDGETIHGRRKAYVASAFDVAHDRGAWTGIFAGKPKFHLYDDSYDATRGAEDALPPDHGRDKIDRFFVDPVPATFTDALIAELTRTDAPRTRFFLVHYAIPDLTAHAKGWDVTPGSAYMKAIAEVDLALGRILDVVEASPSLRGHTAIVLTTDHGGGAPFKSHDQPHMWVNYVIPFLVWTGGGASTDLYALNATTRRDPGLGRPRPGDGAIAAVRNSDAGNLCLDLLGMPAIPGSTVNAAQDLRAVVAPSANEPAKRPGG